jgi:hypothetical protein
MMEQVVFLENTAELATAEGTLVRKQILPKNRRFMWPGQPGKFLAITEEILDQIVNNFSQKYIDTVPFVKVTERNAHTEDPEAARGIVVGLEKTESGLDALIQPINEGVREQMLATQLGASAGLQFKFKKRDTGDEVGAVLRHVAWTPEPWIAGMKSFEAVSLSGEAVETVFLSAEEIEVEGRETHMDITKEDIDKAIADATTPIVKTLEETQVALSESTEKIAELTTALEERRASMTEEAVEAELSALITAGLPPAVAKIAKPIMLASGDNVVNLSADEASTVGAQVRELLKLYPKVDFRELGEGEMKGYVVLSDEQVEALGVTPPEGAEEGEGKEQTEEEKEDAKLTAEVVSLIPEDKRNSK